MQNFLLAETMTSNKLSKVSWTKNSERQSRSWKARKWWVTMTSHKKTILCNISVNSTTADKIGVVKSMLLSYIT